MQRTPTVTTIDAYARLLAAYAAREYEWVSEDVRRAIESSIDVAFDVASMLYLDSFIDDIYVDGRVFDGALRGLPLVYRAEVHESLFLKFMTGE